MQDKEEPRILDIGVEDYNSICPQLINNDLVEYWQLDPFKKSKTNDGFYFCTMQECADKYPDSISKFDIIFDIGVLGWNGTKFNQLEQEKYIKNIIRLLKKDGLYILHSDRIEQDPEYQINLEKFIAPNFVSSKFSNYQPVEVIQCPVYGTIWDIRFLRKK